MMISILRGLAVIWFVFTLVFMLVRLLPSDPIMADANSGRLTTEQVEARRQQLGLNKPIHQQYFDYLANVLQGNWGYSFVSSESVRDLVWGRLGPTMALAFGSFGIALFIGIGLGIAAVSNNRLISHCADVCIAISQAIPIYVSALLGIYLFSLKLNWFPSGGSSTPIHLILPCSILGFHTASPLASVLRTNLKVTYGSPYILTAHAKGLYPIDILEHALRVAILPTVSVLALQAGFLLSGTVVIEVVFVRRGLGNLLLEAVLNRDYPIIQALSLWSSVMYVLALNISRLMHKAIDPRR